MGLNASHDVRASPCDDSCPSRMKYQGLKRLADPRSPSSAIDRTPIQVGASVSPSSGVLAEDWKARPFVEAAASCSPTVYLHDPRSPSLGVDRSLLTSAEVIETLVESERSAMETDSSAPVKTPQPSEPLPYPPCTDSVGETEGSRTEVEQR
uniref:cell division cycle-associated protein 3-like n=1 Tax=Myxine glutinosa TaxID=7769 RepID=UPI00358E351F